ENEGEQLGLVTDFGKCDDSGGDQQGFQHQGFPKGRVDTAMTRTTSPPRVRCSCHRSGQTTDPSERIRGRTHHGLRTKYVDAYRTSMMLVGDYSPRTERILPTQIAFGKRLFSGTLGAVDSETVALGLDRAHAKMLFDQRLILEEGIRYQAQFAT